MKLNSSYTVSLFTILISTFMSMMSNNWLFMWMLMEINLFMFIPIMSKNKVTNQSIKYFILQSFSSYLLIFSILMMSIFDSSWNNSMFTSVALLIKIGMAPFHMWIPEIMKMISWNECFILSTLIKITPMILMNKLCSFKLIILPISLSLIMGSLSGFNQTSLKKIMAFSSVFNMSWMLTSFYLKKKILLIFISIYFLLTFKIMKFFKINSMVYVNQINHLNLENKMKINLMMLSMMGLPPLMGFLPKWFILKELSNKSNFISMCMILTSLMSIFMYIQMNSISLMNLSYKKKNFKQMNLYSISTINLFCLPFMYLLIE
uniref:NADH-ubiquinone oxidoreductase chain 2 n=1 Tax=Purohita sinica TaxID=871393 RepID=A0A7S5DCR2_9HEMI|nr:NADH dehydrogenase subunit 2 [Purohita sinica]